MIVIGNNIIEIEKIYYYLIKEFEMKDLRVLKYFLDIEVFPSKQEILLSQRKYVIDLLAKTGNSACPPADNPTKVNHGLIIYSDEVG